MRKALVTGAAGFLGHRLVSALQSRDVATTALVRRGKERPGLIVRDICQPLSPDTFLGCDTVFHAAAKVHALSEVAQDDEEYFAVNTRGTRHVLEAAQAAQVRRFVLLSSVKAMSHDDTPLAWDDKGTPRPWSEADLVQPDTPYGRSKLEAEKLVLSGDYVPEPVVLRLCMVYGPGAKGNITRMIEAIHRKRFPPFPDTQNRRSMVHAQDVIDAALLAGERAEAVGETFLVSDGQAYSTAQIYELVCRTLGRPIPQRRVPFWSLQLLAAVGDAIGLLCRRRFVFDSDALRKLSASAWFSSEKLTRMLGYSPKWTLARALPGLVEECQDAARGRSSCSGVALFAGAALATGGARLSRPPCATGPRGSRPA